MDTITGHSASSRDAGEGHIAPARERTTLVRVAPAIGLFLLSPLVAEYLLGNVAIDAIAALLVLGPLYGGGTLLIREAARRAGRGWPTMLLLGLAFAIFEEGLLTQSLFNPGYAGADLLRVTFVPALGIGVWWTLFVLTLHTVWSTTVPIALIEGLVPAQSATPWLGNIGLAVTVVLFVFGAVATYLGTYQQFQFMASAPQLIASAMIVLALIAVAFAMPDAPRPRLAEPAPNPWLVGAISLALSSLFMIATLFVDTLSGWGVVAIYLLLDAVAISLIWRWSGQEGWGQMHIVALAGGALLTYAWHAFPQWPVVGTPGQIDLIGNIIFALGAVILLAAAARRVGSRESGVGKSASRQERADSRQPVTHHPITPDPAGTAVLPGGPGQ